MNVIFLDIDGVLNDSNSKTKTPTGFVGIDDKKVKILSKLVTYLDAKVVLSTTWKEEWNKNKNLCTKDGIYMINKLKYKGNISIFDKITDINNSCSTRGAAILNWISDFETYVDKYIILDDFDFDFAKYPELTKHVILMEDGITTASAYVDDCLDYVKDCIGLIKEF